MFLVAYILVFSLLAAEAYPVLRNSWKKSRQHTVKAPELSGSAFLIGPDHSGHYHTGPYYIGSYHIGSYNNSVPILLSNFSEPGRRYILP